MSNRNNQGLSNRVIVVVGPAGKLGPIWCRTILEAGSEVVGLGVSVSNDFQILDLMLSFPDKIHQSGWSSEVLEFHGIGTASIAKSFK